MNRCKRPLFYALTALMAYVAAERLAFVFPHLSGGLALDLSSRYRAVEIWFGGHGLYPAQQLDLSARELPDIFGRSSACSRG